MVPFQDIRPTLCNTHSDALPTRLPRNVTQTTAKIENSIADAEKRNEGKCLRSKRNMKRMVNLKVRRALLVGGVGGGRSAVRVVEEGWLCRDHDQPPRPATTASHDEQPRRPATTASHDGQPRRPATTTSHHDLPLTLTPPTPPAPPPPHYKSPPPLHPECVFGYVRGGDGVGRGVVPRGGPLRREQQRAEAVDSFDELF